MRVLVTGGAGFIGTHTLVSLIEQGHDPLVIDDFQNSNREGLRRVEALVGKTIDFHER